MKEQLEKIYSSKGEFNEIKKGLKDLSIEDKKIVGSLANEITQKLEQSISDKFKLFYEKELNEKLQKERIDVTMPGQFIPKGHAHLLTSTTEEICSIFQSLGFSVITDELAPEVETESPCT